MLLKNGYENILDWKSLQLDTEIMKNKKPWLRVNWKIQASSYV